MYDRFHPHFRLEEPSEIGFNPYVNNGGSVLAIAGEDFAVIAADTRLSSDTSILTRDQKKLFPLTDYTVLASTGCWCDTLALTNVITLKKDLYSFEHRREMSTTAIAQMLSVAMYCKRALPYYVFNVLAGFDDEGKGCVYNFDVLGHSERVMYHAGGCSGVLLLPLMDNKLAERNVGKPKTEPNEQIMKTTKLPKDEILAIVKDLFVTAAERDIFTGDGVHINVITHYEIEEESFALRKD